MTMIYKYFLVSLVINEACCCHLMINTCIISILIKVLLFELTSINEKFDKAVVIK